MGTSLGGYELNHKWLNMQI